MQINLFIKNTFLFLFLTIYWLSVHASMTSTWVLDPDHELNKDMHQFSEKLLKEVDKAGHVHLSLVVFNIASEEALIEKAIKSIIAWEAKFPEKQIKSRRSYLVMNLATQEVLILLGNRVVRTQALEDSLSMIKQGIIIPALQTGHAEKAIVEGLIALSVAFQEWPSHQVSAPPSPMMDLLFKLLKWTFIITGGVGIYFGLKKYFHRPEWQPQETPEDLFQKALLEDLRSCSTLMKYEP